MTILILGGAGRTGARIHHRLTTRGVPTHLAARAGLERLVLLSGRGRLQLPAPDMPEAFVDLDDVADAAVLALMRTTPEDSTYELSGPELLTFTDVAAVLTQACGRNVVPEVVDVPTFVADLATDGIPAEEAEPLGHLFTEILDGRNASLGDGIEQLLGRPASSFSSYARAAAKTGVWA